MAPFGPEFPNFFQTAKDRRMKQAPTGVLAASNLGFVRIVDQSHEQLGVLAAIGQRAPIDFHQ